MNGRISEIFNSVQGEGLYLGESQMFVRFFGCNLSCKFCDTLLDTYTDYTPTEVIREIRLFSQDFHSVAFTGGEPLVQDEFLQEVLFACRHEGYLNYLETNGTLPQALGRVIELVDIISMDFKLPSSTGLRPYWDEHRRFLEIASTKETYVKAVVGLETTQADIVEAARLIHKVNPAVMLVLQPNGFEDSEVLDSKLVYFRELCRREKIFSCVIPQIHKAAGIR